MKGVFAIRQHVAQDCAGEEQRILWDNRNLGTEYLQRQCGKVYSVDADAAYYGRVRGGIYAGGVYMQGGYMPCAYS